MAQVDYFLKIDGVEGESTDDKHKGEIELQTWSIAGTNSGSHSSGGGAGSGKVTLQDFHFVKKTDKSSAKLLASCCTGEHLKTATLVCRKAGKDQQEYLTFKFYDVLVSSYQTGASQEIPMDQASINFSKIEIEYRQQGPDGKLGPADRFGFDLKGNKSF